MNPVELIDSAGPGRVSLLVVGVLAIALAQLARRGARQTVHWTAAIASEEGAAYSLSYVITMPIYVLFVCLIIEVALIMTVKLGTIYAAFAAARSYAVWLPLNPGQAKSKADQAAAQAMTAFASGDGGGGGGGLGSAYQQYASGESVRVSASYIDRKRGNAGGSTRVSVESMPSAWNGDIKVRVHYDMPFHIPAIGRLFGGGTYPIESRWTMQVEGVKDKSIGTPNPLGIRYDPGEL